MNNPFYYTPSPECLQAAREVADWLEGKPSPFCLHSVSKEFREEIDKGKMFGVLIISPGSSPKKGDSTPSSSPPYIAAYSGQVCGRSDWPEFAPAVFDYLQPDGYFKRHEAEITEINDSLTSGTSPTEVRRDYDNGNPKPKCCKERSKGETEDDFIRRRQFENAELHRWKLRERARLASAEADKRQREDKLIALKTLRRQKSDDLQRWLFSNFHLLNGKGESKDLLQIWTDSHSLNNRHSSLGTLRGVSSPYPPSGSGECCEPKLLQYAFAHGLKPVSMVMFWWGESPKAEVRHHLHFYPACNSKCKPILGWMLQGIDVDPNPLENSENDKRLAAQLKTLYEDDDICVISKPAGLLSVPGKSGRESVSSIMRRHSSSYIVHRLDMDTSGLMVIAKTAEAYHNLQQQFANHEIKKKYVAIITNPVNSSSQSEPLTGRIALPLRPDFNDRPRQVVDFEYGHPAVTDYQFVSENRVWLFPRTGRTHQLRIHCAHRLGLNNPIKGDRLYGTESADRLYLHAEEISFTHPSTARRMTFTDKAPF